ncbi:MAG: DMT family transporter [Enterovibrio sp.]
MRNYLLLIVIGLLWGSQFIFMQHASHELAPILIATGRSLCGSITLAIVCYFMRLKRESTPWRIYMLIALFDATIPFIMVAWGQQHVDSAIASVIMGCIPFITTIAATFFLVQEKLSGKTLLSVLFGFCGVLVLFWPQFAKGVNSGMLGALAILFGASCFAIGLLLIKRLAVDHPVVVARNILACSMLQLLILSPVMLDLKAITVPSLPAISAILMLGVFSTGLVYFLYMLLIQKAGPTFASFSNYLVPLFGVLLGALFLNEQISITTWVALVIILSAIAMNQWASAQNKPKPQTVAQ